MKLPLSLQTVLVLLLGYAEPSRILVLYPFGTLSHKLSFYPVIEALGAKGHNVTVVTMFQPKVILPNVKEIVLPGGFEENDFKILFDIRKVPKVVVRVVTFFKIAEYTEKTFSLMMANEEFRDILLKKEIDLIIADSIYNDFCMPIIDALNLPFILVSSNIPMIWHLEPLGGSAAPAITPYSHTPYTIEMTFFQRLDNVILHYATLLSRRFVLIPRVESYTKKHFPNFKSVQETEQKVSIIFTASNPSYTWPRLLPPVIVEIGAVHCRPTKPLPQNLQIVADESSENGFIVFSLGSLIRASELPQEFTQAFLKAFAQIPQKVIWKWESDSLEAPANVYLVKWLPQQDLLGHPNARLFISHGGLLGVQESVYHGVPLLGLPIANDQHGNIKKLVYEGMALQLDWDEITEDIIFEAITSLTTNSSYKQNADRLSRIMRDTEVPGIDKALYWIDYVLRYNGTEHLKIFYRLNWFQLNLIDVALFLLFCACLLLTVSFLAWCKVFRLFLRKFQLMKEKKNK